MTSSLRWQTLPFDAFTPHLLYAVLELRTRVFVVEQNCVYNDLDGEDIGADHLVALDGERPVAHARILAPDAAEPGYASIGRVVVDPDYRRMELGRELMRRAVDECRRLHPDAPIWIGAQSYLERFYSSLGFRTVGPEFDLDGIPHLPMVLRSDVTTG